MSYLDVLQFLGSLGFTVGLLPQFIHTLRRRQAEDMDVWFLGLVILSSVLLLFYVLPTRQYFLAASYAANVIVWGTVLYFRWRPAGGRSKVAP